MAKQNLEQGEGGFHKSPRGDHLDPKGEGRHKGGTRTPPSQKGGNLKANVQTRTAKEGSHLTPHPSITEKTAVRGGGGNKGHDRTSPTLGKNKAGDHLAAQPGLTPRSKRPSKTYLGA